MIEYATYRRPMEITVIKQYKISNSTHNAANTVVAMVMAMALAGAAADAAADIDDDENRHSRKPPT